MVCLQRFLVFVLFILVNFTNLSWKEFNIIISLYCVELYLKIFSYSCFLFGSWGGGGGGCI